ncbi:hypothetical protein N9Q05_00135 [bacterium]|nr:hypothetical protein [bacterium]
MWILFTLLCILSALSFPRWYRKVLLKRWQKTLNLDRHSAIYNQLFASTNGFLLSRQARTHGDAMEYVYGEIDFTSFIALLSLLKPDNTTVFYDLGSGVGKAVIACAMVFNVRKSCGIELFYELHSAALTQQHDLQQIPAYLSTSNTICFIHDNFFDANFNDATLIFINAAGYFGETWIKLNSRLEQILHCTHIITISKRLVSPVYILVKITTVKMSWGVVNAYIHERITGDPIE